MVTKKGTLLLMTILTMFSAGCHRQQSPGSLLPDTLQLQEGDIVFRRCTGLTSCIVVAQDRDGIFSHTGIVVDSSGTKMIVHAVPDEPDFPGDPDRVKLESVASFFSSAHAVAAAVARTAYPEAGTLAAQYAMRRYREGTLFDHDFNDEDTTRLYCTQLITLAYEKAGIHLVDTIREVIDLPSFHYRCILPSQIQQSPLLHYIFMFNP